MTPRVKICGLSTPADIAACADAGAAYVGFMFFEKSPRHLTIEAAKALAVEVPVGLAKVAVSVNPTDAFLDSLVATVPLDMLQLHGSESIERVAAIKSRYGLPVMKVVGIADESDVPALTHYSGVADQILVDAKPPKTAELPGGMGLSFDWRMIAGRRWTVPWMLAGGLTPDNVAEAIRLTGASQVDVSSGVESAPGAKDADLINRFVSEANTAS